MDPFVLRVILSFIVGGLYVAFIIWLSEKFGSKIGGIIGGVPTTALISIIFIGLTAGHTAAQRAALIVTPMVATTLILVYVYTRFLFMRSEIALLLALLVWFFIALMFVKLKLTNLKINVAIAITGMALTAYGVRNYPKNLKVLTRVLRKTYAVRVVTAGSVIASAVIAARIAGPVWGGIFSSFPASFVSTLYMLNRSQGPEFTKAVARQLPISNGGTLTFAALFYLLILHIGLPASVIIGVAGSALYVLLLLKFNTREKPKTGASYDS